MRWIWSYDIYNNYNHSTLVCLLYHSKCIACLCIFKIQYLYTRTYTIDGRTNGITAYRASFFFAVIRSQIRKKNKKKSHPIEVFTLGLGIHMGKGKKPYTHRKKSIKINDLFTIAIDSNKCINNECDNMIAASNSIIVECRHHHKINVWWKT